MFTQTPPIKQKPREMPSSVTQGTRILGKTSLKPGLLYRSAKNPGMCVAESSDELFVGQAVGLRPDTRFIRPQPLTVDVVSGQIMLTHDEVLQARKKREQSDARNREYTPDFRLDMLDGRRIIVEVKSRRYPGKKEYWDKVEKAKRVLLANGYLFQTIYVDYEADAALVHNVSLLNAICINFKQALTQDQVEAIEADVGNEISSLGHVAKLAGLTLREAPVLVLRGVVSADISKANLGSLTPVRLAHGSLEHLAVFNLDGGEA